MSFKCLECGETFNTKPGLKRHMAKKHKKKPREKYNLIQLLEKCNFCGLKKCRRKRYAYLLADDLIKHRRKCDYMTLIPHKKVET